MRIFLAALLVWMVPLGVQASVVDATDAEAAFQRGDYQAARMAFADAVERFRTASKDSSDYRVYREAAYLYDRLADCCFTQRDWESLKLYVDGLVVVSVSERNLLDSQFTGALVSGIAYATASYLGQRLDEAVRFSNLLLLKRSIGLMLLDAGGAGEQGETAIALYQRQAAALRGVMIVEDGGYALDVNALDRNLAAFEEIVDELGELGDVDALWVKYPPQGGKTAVGAAVGEPANGS